MNNADRKKLLLYGKTGCLILAAIFSFTVIADYVTSTAFAGSTVEYLAGKQTNVLALAATSTAASTAVSLLPGDIASPLANQLADINKYALIVLLAVFIEKFMVTLTGFLAFKFIVPGVCLLLVGNLLLFKSRQIRQLAVKFLIFALVLFAAVPLSVQASRLIETTHELSLQEAIEETQKDTDMIEQNAEKSDDSQSFWDKTVNFFKDGVSNIADGTTGVLKKFTQTLNNLLEAVVVLIVTSCVIPLAVMFFLIWFTKTLFAFKWESGVRKIPFTPTEGRKII